MRPVVSDPFRRDAVFPSGVNTSTSMAVRACSPPPRSPSRCRPRPQRRRRSTRSSRATCRPAPAGDQRENDHGPRTGVHPGVDGRRVPRRRPRTTTRPTDAVGDFTLLVDAPFQDKGERAFTITVTRRCQHRSATPVAGDQPGASTCGRGGRAPSRRVRFRGRGFMQPRPVYAHYLSGGKERKTVRLARRDGRPVRHVQRQAAADPGQEPAHRPLDGADRPEAGLRPAAGPGVRPAADRRLRDVRQCFRRRRAPRPGRGRSVSSPSAASTSIRSPAANSPLSRPSASGSTRRLEITRLSGRAPYVGS